jgi:hypothetical protein
MQASYKAHLPSVLLLCLSGLSSLVFLSTGFFMGIGGFIELITGEVEMAGSTLTLAAGSIFLGLLLLPAVYYSMMHIMDKPAREIPFHKFPTSAIVAIWVLSALSTVLLAGVESMALLSIPLNLATIVLPVWVFIRIGLRDLDAGSNERRWGTFTVGLTVVPILIGIAEVIVLLIAGVGLILWVALNPQLINSLESLSMRLMYSSNPDAITQILAPYIFNPTMMVAVLAFFSLLIPIIEELIKPLGVWFSPNRIVSPGQGFALGVLGGAAYALVESLGVSPGFSGTENLLSIIRAGTDLLHITTAGLMGWALVSAWRDKKYLQLGITYLVVIVIHGLWNAMALSSAAQIAMDYYSNPSPWLINMPIVTSLGLVVLSIVNLLILIMANRKLIRNLAV